MLLVGIITGFYFIIKATRRYFYKVHLIIHTLYMCYQSEVIFQGGRGVIYNLLKRSFLDHKFHSSLKTYQNNKKS